MTPVPHGATPSDGDPDTDGDPVRSAVARLAGGSPLRSGQEESIRAVLQRDTLAVLATGTGKTLIYRVAGAVLGGMTLVVSPTVSLQMDQLLALAGSGQRAEALHSLLPRRRRAAILQALAAGTLDVVLMAPEQLTKDDVLAALDAAPPRLFTVDEAHCVDSWGRDFRPDYLGLAAVVERLGHPRVLALTATASPSVRRGIVAALGMREPAVIVGEVDRPNIWLGARLASDEDDAATVAADLAAEQLRDGTGSVIVYAATRRRVETLAAGLRDAGLPAEHFHGTLARKRREELTAHFHTGELRVVVATSAFGLGIDKPDVRLVVHADPPEDLESLYQQVGRAGRDGEPARGVMVARPSGYGLPHFFAARSDTRHEDLRAVLKAVGTQPIRVSDLGRQSQLSAPRVRRAVNALLGVGAIREERVGLRRAGSGTHDAAVIDEAMAAGERRTARAETGVELVRRYAETDDCRRRLVLQLLGEQVGAPCGNCDNCDAGLSRPATEMETEIGSVVHHPEFGRGTVQQIETDRVVILFDEVGYRTLSLGWAEEHRLLDEETA